MKDDPLPPETRARLTLLYDSFADRVESWLRRRYHGVDPDAVSAAVVDALVRAAIDSSARRPPGEIPEPDELEIYSRARDNLRSHFRGEMRRRRRQDNYQQSVTRRRVGAPTPLEEAETRELIETVRDLMAKNDEERRAFDFKLQGHNSPDQLAGAMGWPGPEGVERAKRLLANFRQRLKRFREKFGAEDGPDVQPEET